MPTWSNNVNSHQLLLEKVFATDDDSWFLGYLRITRFILVSTWSETVSRLNMWEPATIMLRWWKAAKGLTEPWCEQNHLLILQGFIFGVDLPEGNVWTSQQITKRYMSSPVFIGLAVLSLLPQTSSFSFHTSHGLVPFITLFHTRQYNSLLEHKWKHVDGYQQPPNSVVIRKATSPKFSSVSAFDSVCQNAHYKRDIHSRHHVYIVTSSFSRLGCNFTLCGAEKWFDSCGFVSLWNRKTIVARFWARDAIVLVVSTTDKMVGRFGHFIALLCYQVSSLILICHSEREREREQEGDRWTAEVEIQGWISGWIGLEETDTCGKSAIQNAVFPQRTWKKKTKPSGEHTQWCAAEVTVILLQKTVLRLKDATLRGTCHLRCSGTLQKSLSFLFGKRFFVRLTLSSLFTWGGGDVTCDSILWWATKKSLTCSARKRLLHLCRRHFLSESFCVWVKFLHNDSAGKAWVVVKVDDHLMGTTSVNAGSNCPSPLKEHVGFARTLTLHFVLVKWQVHWANRGSNTESTQFGQFSICMFRCIHRPFAWVHCCKYRKYPRIMRAFSTKILTSKLGVSIICG